MTAAPNTVTFRWNFAQGAQGWQSGFADYPLGSEALFELDAGVRSLPANLGGAPALFISGHNRSDDLFMYFYQSVGGLAPETTYQVRFDIELASDAPDGSVGIGGSPANSVYLKAGATQIEPLTFYDPVSQLALLNIDKGEQSNAGRDSVVLGDIAKPDDGTFSYALIARRSDPFTFRTNAEGSGWVYFGTDSGFEGLTTLYYTRFEAEFTPAAVAVPESSSLLPLLVVGLILSLRVGRQL